MSRLTFWWLVGLTVAAGVQAIAAIAARIAADEDHTSLKGRVYTLRDELAALAGTLGYEWGDRRVTVKTTRRGWVKTKETRR